MISLKIRFKFTSVKQGKGSLGKTLNPPSLQCHSTGVWMCVIVEVSGGGRRRLWVHGVYGSPLVCLPQVWMGWFTPVIMHHVKRTPSRSLRSTGQALLLVSKTNRKLRGDRAFAVAAPRLWNEQPLHIRLTESLPVFKSLLKTHLFSLAFNSVWGLTFTVVLLHLLLLLFMFILFLCNCVLSHCLFIGFVFSTLVNCVVFKVLYK